MEDLKNHPDRKEILGFRAYYCYKQSTLCDIIMDFTLPYGCSSVTQQQVKTLNQEQALLNPKNMAYLREAKNDDTTMKTALKWLKL